MQSAQGPVYLGNRLGHLRSESRVFRALVYNKGGVVLHMLRRLIGDEAFFRGIRRFYAESRFHKTSTDQLRVAMEREAGRPLERFFDRWIYGSTLPRVTFSYRVESTAGRTGGGPALRAIWRALRPAGHRDAPVRRSTVGRRRRSRHRSDGRQARRTRRPAAIGRNQPGRWNDCGGVKSPLTGAIAAETDRSAKQPSTIVSSRSLRASAGILAAL